MELERIFNCVVAGERDQVVAKVNKALQDGIKAKEIISEGLIKGMDEVGQRMKDGDMYVPEVLMAANTMKAGLQVVKPLMEGESTSRGKIAIGTVAGDLHDIGKNLVCMMLEGAGFEVIDVGIDVSVEKFVQVVEKEKPDLVGLSALLTTTMKSMKEIVQAIGGKTKTIIGGAPVTEEFAKEIGASGYAPDAVTAIDVAKSLLA
jgi:5-methyltetrahydrofolate--homocysteine methyltransferase